MNIYRKRIIIEGNENAGKTTLLKSIYLSLIKVKTPLIFFVDDIKNKRSDKLVKSAFLEQYGDNELDFIKFQQVDATEKVAIIDDADKIKEEQLKRFIEYLSNEFAYIILSSKRKWNFNIVEEVKIELNKEKEFFKLKLNGFFSDKRKELIKNIYLVRVADDANMETITQMVKRINDFIKNQIHVFRIDPDFILQFVEYYSATSEFDKPDKNVFSKVFETNIVNAIRKCDKKANVDEIFIALEEVAYWIHFSKKYPLSNHDFVKIIEDYNEEYDQDIKVKSLCDIAIKAKILKEIGNWEIRFCNNNYLAFFVARRLNRKFNENHDPTDLLYVLNNICFGINGDVVLFLSYITSNIQILKAISEAAEKHMSSWTEFSLDEDNIKFLSNYNSSIEVRPPSSSDKERLAEMETKAEQAAKNEEILEAVDIYDYNEADAETGLYKVLKALKYTELMAKALPNFRHMLPRDMKETFTKNIYLYPNKIIYYCLHDIDVNFDQIVEGIINYNKIRNDGKHKKKELTKQNVAVLLQKLSIAMILTLYDFFANLAVEGGTIKTLNKFDFTKNTNHIIHNTMMEENSGNITDFIDKIDDLYKNSKKPVVKLMAKQIVRKCLLHHDRIKLQQEEHLKNKYFDKFQRKSLLITKIARAQNKA